jgi:glycosyltransferase involved in cell wall biosynthesis
MVAKKQVRIGFDARLAGQTHAGIGRYSENLIRNLIPLVEESGTLPVTLVIFFYDQTQAKQVMSNFFTHKQVELVYTGIKHYGLREQLLLPKIYKKAKLDLLYVPHWNVPLAYRGKLLITVHDLLWHEQKGMQATTLKAWQYPIKYLAYRLISSSAISRASTIFVPTKTIASTIANYYKNTHKKVVVCNEGIAPLYEKALKTTVGSQKISKQFIYTGSLYPHKNLKLIIQSLRKLPKHKLLIASSRNLFQRQIRTLAANYKVKKQVVFLGFVSDEKLIELYQKSLALVQPSFSEGFGLTGIEAMASQTAVLASDIPVFREIYQDAALFFDPHSTTSFLEAVKTLELSDRKKILKKGLAVAASYSFSQMAEELWQEMLSKL